jgi:hypothetical protein
MKPHSHKQTFSHGIDRDNEQLASWRSRIWIMTKLQFAKPRIQIAKEDEKNRI